MTEKCEPEKRFDLQFEALKEHISDLKENFVLRIKALQLEYEKSEDNYPTRQQLNEVMGKLLTKEEFETKYGYIIKILSIIIAALLGIVMVFLAMVVDYLGR
jgi:hypothetical protein